MENFYYSSSSSHGIMGPTGKKLKTTTIEVKNGLGTLSMRVEDNSGSHSDTRKLTEKEVRNIKKHKFMPKLFSSTLTNIKNSKSSAKKNTKKHRSSKQDTRKHK
jgi:hypothetical protein